MARGGHLASIGDTYEQNAVWMALLNSECLFGDLTMVGGNDLDEEGTWVWSDGSLWTGFEAWAADEHVTDGVEGNEDDTPDGAGLRAKDAHRRCGGRA